MNNIEIKFMIIYGLILIGSLIVSTLIVIGMKWLYEKNIEKHK